MNRQAYVTLVRLLRQETTQNQIKRRHETVSTFPKKKNQIGSKFGETFNRERLPK